MEIFEFTETDLTMLNHIFKHHSIDICGDKECKIMQDKIAKACVTKG